MKTTTLVAALAVPAALSAAQTPDALFDFEDPDSALITPGTVLSSNGIDVEFEGTGVLVDLLEPGPFGSFAYAPLSSLTLNFPGRALGVRVEFAEFGPGPQTVDIQLFSGADGTGTQWLDEAFVVDAAYPDVAVFEFIFLANLPIGSMIIDAGDQASAVRLDNIGVFVPAPGAAAVLGLCGLAITRRRC